MHENNDVSSTLVVTLLYIIISVNKQLINVLPVAAYKNTTTTNLEHFKKGIVI